MVRHQNHLDAGALVEEVEDMTGQSKTIPQLYELESFVLPPCPPLFFFNEDLSPELMP